MNNETTRQIKWRKIQTALLVGVVVGLPAISFLVNVYGAKSGKAFYSGIKNNLGKIGDFNTVGWNNDTVSSKTVKGKVVVVAFTSSTNREEMINTLKPIVKTEQFREEVDNLQFLTFDTSSDSAYYHSFINQLNSKDKEIWHLLRGGSELATQLKIPNEYNISLIDTAGVIRRFYDIRNNEDRRLLVEHIAIMPIKNKKDVEKKEQKKL
jgi:hypothetical protein